jgi:hypothetical protein
MRNLLRKLRDKLDPRTQSRLIDYYDEKIKKEDKKISNWKVYGRGKNAKRKGKHGKR